MNWRFYCPHCEKIKNRLQVSKGTDNIRFYWYRCRDCGTQVIELKRAIEQAISTTRRFVDKVK